jgi:hypothetical protein
VIAPAAKPDQYPFPFWPPLPWDDDPATYLWDAPPVEGEDQETTRERKRAARKVFMNERMYRNNDDSRWTGVRFLGEGGYGKAGLWVETDDNGIITDVCPCFFSLYELLLLILLQLDSGG